MSLWDLGKESSGPDFFLMTGPVLPSRRYSCPECGSEKLAIDRATGDFRACCECGTISVVGCRMLGEMAVAQ